MSKAVQDQLDRIKRAVRADGAIDEGRTVMELCEIADRLSHEGEYATIVSCSGIVKRWNPVVGMYLTETAGVAR